MTITPERLAAMAARPRPMGSDIIKARRHDEIQELLAEVRRLQGDAKPAETFEEAVKQAEAAGWEKFEGCGRLPYVAAHPPRTRTISVVAGTEGEARAEFLRAWNERRTGGT